MMVVIFSSSSFNMLYSYKENEQKNALDLLIEFLFGTQKTSQPATTTQEKTDAIDYGLIRTSIKQFIDTQLATNDQPYSEQKKIHIFREKTSNNIIELLQAEKISSLNVGLQKGKDLTKSSLKEFIVTESALYGGDYLKKLHSNPHPINPALLHKIDLKQLQKSIYNQLTSEVDQILTRREEYGGLKKLIGNPLDTMIKSIIDRQLGITGFTGKKFDIGSDIYELYPQFITVDRKKEFDARREEGTLHQEDDCPICLEQFSKLGKRVTLYCGHSLCPNDLNAMMYSSNDKHCPICRRDINPREFPQAHLRAHQNNQ